MSEHRPMGPIACAVFDFLRNEVGVRRFASDSDLKKDLGIDGDDAVELLERFSQAFDVDAGDFDCAEYFGPEAGFNPFSWLWRLTKTTQGLKPFTVGDLVRAAEKRKF
ncbi:DUF1493 family protein [Candidatus Thiodictyon syntrophicum]|uniref:Acyl carrier protein n=1 Tax=Candidatus Thiodictyon syntrophicum TaxID=1166950 RepID=A0A2K8UIZ1_9GAMM|nr:DUF1493 family protein [Candidatus Thiodictyon syntrophicum]AUB85536.1 hypothetical protein THSYN_31990 [Candidatus Thiodictyon syntrophicum]